jgi:poly(3-hydroxybutyrate) depolymerase
MTGDKSLSVTAVTISFVASMLVAGSILALRPAFADDVLPKLGADLAQSSVSGLSSGAFMAVQIEVAHAKNIVGAGIVAGGPFACAQSAAGEAFPFWPTAVAENAAQALYRCMQTDWGPPDPAASVKRAKDLAEEGAIDPIADVADDRVYLFSGNEDQTVARSVVQAAEGFYMQVGVEPANITLVEKEGGHGFLTEQEGTACETSAAPYVNDCDYNQAQAILAWIYGPLSEASPKPSGQFIVFDQGNFAGPGDGLAAEGMVYVPESCVHQAGCRIHIALHGCEQSRETIGDTFIKESGFAEIADQNRLIILFPQARASTINPKGCWDWWGYTGLGYLGKDAPQIKAIWAMVEWLASAP